MEIVNAIAIKDQDKFDSLDLPNQDVQIEYRITTPFVVETKAEKGPDDDVVIRGPVYVGDEDMLDRHGELVDYEAMMAAWDKYSKNPVILYNHSKTYGVIGKMTGVAMDEFGDFGTVPVGTAEIDAGEKDITRKIRKGMLKAFSIGFIAKAAVKVCEDKEEECYIRFTEIDWVETSVVDVPASPGALFNVEKTVTLAGAKNAVVAETCDCGGSCCSSKEAIDANTPSISVNGIPEKLESKEQVGTDIFTTAEEAEARAIELGCEGYHTMENEAGETLFMPCASMEDYESSTGDTPESEESETNSVKNPLIELDGLSEANNMADETITETIEETVEEPIATEMAVEVPETKSPSAGTTQDMEKLAAMEAEAPAEVVEEVVEEVAPAKGKKGKKSVEPEDEAEEAVEETEEVAEEEAVEEEAVEEKSTPSGVDILMEVVSVLKDLDSRVAGFESAIADNDSLRSEIEELSATITERDEEIASLTEKAVEAEAEAEMEAEVSKRVAERLASVGVEAEDLPAPSRKSDTSDANPLPVGKSGVTRFDPQPHISPGMNGLAKWLEANLASKGSN
jgi:HK97 family phage prohead protease